MTDDSPSAYLGLSAGANAALGTLAQRITRFCQPVSLVVKAAAGDPDQGGRLILDFGGLDILVARFDLPVAADALAIATRRNQRWRAAETAFAASRAQIAIAAMTPAENLEDLRFAATCVTLTAAVLAQAPGAIGLMWDRSLALSPPERLLDAATQALRGAPARDVWIDIEVMPGPAERGQPTFGVLTHGLAAFVGREIELQPAALPPAVLAARVAGMVDLALAKGPVFRDGDTAGITPREHIEIRHLVSAHRPGTPIFWMKVHKLDDRAAGGAGRP